MSRALQLTEEEQADKDESAALEAMFLIPLFIIFAVNLLLTWCIAKAGASRRAIAISLIPSVFLLSNVLFGLITFPFLFFPIGGFNELYSDITLAPFFWKFLSVFWDIVLRPDTPSYPWSNVHVGVNHLLWALVYQVLGWFCFGNWILTYLSRQIHRLAN